MEPTEADRWIVMVQGELDASSRRHMADLAAILAGPGRDVELDLSGVTFVDSSGWAAVEAAVEALEAGGVAARVGRMSEPVRRVRAVLGAAQLTPAA
ncbi:MAG: STAS domain-containing protein [Acidobacteriota bacterium]|nr:STAS domain-containing protein [Acidobacteriota bacterium]